MMMMTDRSFERSDTTKKIAIKEIGSSSSQRMAVGCRNNFTITWLLLFISCNVYRQIIISQRACLIVGLHQLILPFNINGSSVQINLNASTMAELSRYAT
jgi:hypothetical protein